MMTRAGRQPIVVADAGPLIRLAAAGLLGTLKALNRRIVLVDRVMDEVCGDPSKPFAEDISRWIDTMGEAISHVKTVYGAGIEALKGKRRSPEEDALLKSSLRNSGELALREFVERWLPQLTSEAIVVYEDKRVAALFMDSDFPVTLLTTRSFARIMQDWGINAHAVAALESIADRYDLKPALVGEIDPETPRDLRPLPQEFTP